MPEGLTPEQERERLRLIQQQGEAANELLSVYEKTAKSYRDILDAQKGILGLSKQMFQLSNEQDKSIQKKIDKLTIIETLTKSINTQTISYNKNLLESIKSYEKELEVVKKIETAKKSISELTAKPVTTALTTEVTPTKAPTVSAAIEEVTVKPKINVETPTLTVAPNLVLGPIPQLSVTPDLVVEATPQLVVTPNLVLADPLAPLVVTPNLVLASLLDPLTINPNLVLGDVPQQTVIPNLILGSTPQLIVSPNLQLGASPLQTVIPNLQLAPSPAQMVIPNLQLGAIPQLIITPDLVLGTLPLLTVTPNLVLGPVAQQTVIPNLQLAPSPVQTVIPNLVLADPLAPLMVTPNLILAPTPLQTVTPNLILADPLAPLMVTPNLILVDPLSPLIVNPNLTLGSIPQLTLTPDLIVNTLPQLIVTPNLILGPIPQQIVTPNLILGPVPQYTITPNLILGPVPQQTVVPNLVLGTVPVQTIVPNLQLAPSPVQTVSPNLILGPIPQQIVTPNLVLGPITQQTVVPNLTLAPSPLQTVVPNLVLGPVPQQTVVPNLTLEASPLQTVTPNLTLAPSPVQTVTPNLTLGPVPQQIVTPNLVLGDIPQLSISPNLTLEALPQLTVNPNIVLGDTPQQTVIPNLVLADPLAPLVVIPNLVLAPSPIQTVTPNLLLAPSPVQTVMPNVVAVPPPDIILTVAGSSISAGINPGGQVDLTLNPNQIDANLAGSISLAPPAGTATSSGTPNPASSGGSLGNLSKLITATTDEGKKLQEQIIRVNEKIKAAGGFALDLKDAFAKTEESKLDALLDQAKKRLYDLTDNADYLYRTFQDIVGELKNQNVLLNNGKAAFKAFTDISEKLTSYQKGYGELRDKDFKKYEKNIEKQKEELINLQAKLPVSIRQKQILIDQLEILKANGTASNRQLAFLEKITKEASKEQALLNNTNEALKSGIPLLEKELDLTKQTADTRKDLGGLATAFSQTVSKYAGGLGSFLKMDDALESVEEYNKKLIEGALKSEEVQDRLHKIEVAKLANEKLFSEGSITEVRYQQRLLELEQESYNVKQSAIASVNNIGNKLGALGTLVKGVGLGMLKAFTDPVVLISLFIDKALEANKLAVSLGKNMGYGADQMGRMTSNMISMARNSTNINFTLKNAFEAAGELNTATGLVAEYSADALETQIMLTKQFGLTGEEAAGIYKFSVLTGKSSSVVNDKMVGAFVAARNSLKVGADFKAVMAEASKVSGQLAANLGNNPERIVKAIVQAKALGTTLEQTKAQGEKLLDFESSIESELKAELLTGQQMNLERARAAALQGDQVTVMKELANQGMTLQKFQGMNVLAQKSFAEALGLSADQLTDQLTKQKMAQESGKSLAEITKDEALEAQKRQAIQDKFNAAMDKIKDIIGNLLAGPVGKLLEMFSDILGFVSGILGKWYVLYPLIGLVALNYIPKMMSGFAGVGSSIGGIFAGARTGFQGLMGGLSGLKKGITDAFSAEGGGGIKGFFTKIKEGFKGGIAKGAGKKVDKAAEAAEAGAEGAEKTSTTADKVKGDNAEGFKKKMQNIAAGIKAFADSKVLLGAINLIPSSIGLLLFIPGVLGATAIEKIDGEKVEESLKGLAKGIKAFGDTAITGGAANLILTSVGLVAMVFGVGGAKLIETIKGEKVEESLKGLAKGIKAFGDPAITIGSSNLILASVGLIAMVPGVGGALLIQLIDSKKIKSSLEGLARGIEAFGDTKVIIGSANLVFASIGLTAMIPGVAGALLLQLVDGNKFKKSLSGIGEGISEFGKKAGMSDILKLMLGGPALLLFSLASPGLLLLQLVNGTLIEKTLGGIGKGIAAFSKNVSYGDLIKGAAAIALLGASLIPFTYAIGLMADVDPATVLLGVGAIAALAGVAYLVSKASKDMIVGSVAIAILGAALIPFTFALSLLADVKMENVLAAGAGLLIFGAAVLGLGTLMFTGVGAMVFGAGILALIALGGAMMILGAGLKVVSEGGAGIAQLFQQLSELDASKLDAISPALKSIGEAVLYLGAGGVMSALGKLLGGDSPAKMIQDIAASANGITQVSTGLQSMALALQQVAVALSAIDVSKLEALSDFSDSQSGGTIGKVVSGITEFITSPIKAIGETIGGEKKGGEKGSITPGGTDLTPLITAINEVKASVDKLYAKESTINMDGKKVGTTLSQKSYKVA